MSFFVTNRFLSKLRQYSLRIQQSLSEQTRTADPLDVDSRIKMQHIDLIIFYNKPHIPFNHCISVFLTPQFLQIPFRF